MSNSKLTLSVNGLSTCPVGSGGASPPAVVTVRLIKADGAVMSVLGDDTETPNTVAATPGSPPRRFPDSCPTKTSIWEILQPALVVLTQ